MKQKDFRMNLGSLLCYNMLMTSCAPATGNRKDIWDMLGAAEKHLNYVTYKRRSLQLPKQIHSRLYIIQESAISISMPFKLLAFLFAGKTTPIHIFQKNKK